jgi:hypothetical protein
MGSGTIHKNANLVQKIFCIYGLYMIFTGSSQVAENGLVKKSRQKNLVY